MKGESAHTEVWEYPLVALREAILNALVHRDYTDAGNIQLRIFDDRLEVWSPELLPKLLDIRRLFVESRSIPRNKNIVSIFHSFKQIEQWGSGFQRMRAACKENGNPLPVLNLITDAFVITFNKNEGINSLETLIKNSPGMRLNQISTKLPYPLKTIERWLALLKNDKKIDFRGSKKTGGYYAIPKNK